MNILEEMIVIMKEYKMIIIIIKNKVIIVMISKKYKTIKVK